MREGKVALISGTNSNLGLNIANRLVNELPRDQNLTIIVTSRTLPRAQEAIELINEYAKNLTVKRTGFLEFDYLLINFTDMVSILGGIYEINKKFTKIDYIFVNAAQGVYSGIDWFSATKCICRNLLDAVTFPTYKIQRVGVTSEDAMGLVFQANLFGPFYLVQKLRPLLKNGGRVIWISSIMAEPKFLSFDDLQLLRSPEPYEGSKRLMDLMHVGAFKRLQQEGITSALVHPGIFTSFSFFKFLNFVTYYGMMMLFYLARLLGSKIHNISGYKAANAPVAAAINIPSDRLTQKVASCCNTWGKEFLEYGDVDRTGAEDVIAYLDKLTREWDIKLKDQIADTRKSRP